MAKVTFSSTNTLTQHVNKLNDLSLDIGDLTLLNTTIDSDVVGAINELKSNVDSIGTNLDANIRDAITIAQPGGDGSLRYENSTGVLTYTGPDSATGTAPIVVTSGTISINDATTSSKGAASFSSSNFDVTSGAVSLKDSGISTSLYADNSITSAKFSGTTTLLIQNSSGVTVKTIYSPGS